MHTVQGGHAVFSPEKRESEHKNSKSEHKTVKVNTKTVKVNTKTAKVNTKTVKVKDEIFVYKRRWTACKQVCKTFDINLNDF